MSTSYIECPHGSDPNTCLDCLNEAPESVASTLSNRPIVSDVEDMMDVMVQRASTPNLASLFKAGKAAGLIKPTTGYGETA